MSTDVLYYVGGPDVDDRSELRYSLRSLAQNARFDYRDVFVVGDVPAWFAGAKMPLPPASEKFRNARQSITTYINHPGAADQIVLMMDDIYLLEPVCKIEAIHLGKATGYSAYKTGNGTYARAVRDTTDWLRAHGHPEPLAYLGHTPVLLNTGKARDFLTAYPEHLLLEPFLLYVVAGAAGPGRRGGNAKCAKDDNLDHKLSLDIPYLSSNPDTWTGRLGDLIREKHPTPCRWER